MFLHQCRDTLSCSQPKQAQLSFFFFFVCVHYIPAPHRHLLNWSVLSHETPLLTWKYKIYVSSVTTNAPSWLVIWKLCVILVHCAKSFMSKCYTTQLCLVWLCLIAPECLHAVKVKVHMDCGLLLQRASASARQLWKSRTASRRWTRRWTRSLHVSSTTKGQQGPAGRRFVLAYTQHNRMENILWLCSGEKKRHTMENKFRLYLWFSRSWRNYTGNILQLLLLFRMCCQTNKQWFSILLS